MAVDDRRFNVTEQQFFFFLFIKQCNGFRETDMSHTKIIFEFFLNLLVFQTFCCWVHP